MRPYVPRIVTLWVADIALRLIYLANGGGVLDGAKGRDFLWDGWRNKDQSAGTIMVKKLRSPRWSRVKAFENAATTTDGYGYKFYDIDEKRPGEL